jgi:sulfofructose kinase
VDSTGSENRLADVICYGIICLDTIWRVAQLPRPGGYSPVSDEVDVIGGEAANTALALQRWGASVHLIGGTLGEDVKGRLLSELLRKAFLPSNPLTLNVRPDLATAWCICIATEDGHRTMFGQFSSLGCPPLTPEIAASARLFTIDSTGHLNEGKEAVSIAAEAGVPVIAMDCETLPEICSKADTILVSGERLVFRGLEDSAENMLGWAREKRQEYGASVIVTRGSEGCVMADRDGTEVSLPAYPIREVIDSTGSGDVFRAGYLFGRLQGWERLQTLRFASAAAALNCGQMGAWTGVQDMNATFEFMRRHDGS